MLEKVEEKRQKKVKKPSTFSKPRNVSKFMLTKPRKYYN